MTIEIGLLILESVLLAATVILLLFSLKEGRGRKALLMEVERAVKVLTRHEYFLTVTDSMLDARREISACITGRVPTGEDKNRTKELINGISRLRKEGVRVRYILPKLQDRLHCGLLYGKAGAEVRFSGRPIAHDIRYMVVDGSHVVIGIPEITGEKEATKKGYKIPSEGLAAILGEHFNSCWEQSLRFGEYLDETLKHTGITLKHLSRELNMDEKELEGFQTIKD